VKKKCDNLNNIHSGLFFLFLFECFHVNYYLSCRLYRQIIIKIIAKKYDNNYTCKALMFCSFWCIFATLRRIQSVQRIRLKKIESSGIIIVRQVRNYVFCLCVIICFY
jgi:hypothetical protein